MRLIKYIFNLLFSMLKKLFSQEDYSLIGETIEYYPQIDYSYTSSKYSTAETKEFNNYHSRR